MSSLRNAARQQLSFGLTGSLCCVFSLTHFFLVIFLGTEMPSFLKTPMDLTIRTGAMARLECAAEGHPAPQISWQKDGGTDFPAARERRMHVMPEDDVFFIANVKIEDMGIYSCMAQNVAGGLSANASLTVLGMFIAVSPSFCRSLFIRDLILVLMTRKVWYFSCDPCISSPCFVSLCRVMLA